MTFKDELAAFRAAHPEIEQAELFMVDLNTTVRGKLVPIDGLEKLARGEMKLPSSTAALDIFSDDVLETGLAVQMGDPDGPLDAVPGSLRPMLWAQEPTAQVQVIIRTPDAEVAEYDPRNVLSRVAGKLAERGLKAVQALELEFYLIDPKRPQPPEAIFGVGPLQSGQVYDLEVSRAFDPVLMDIAKAAEALGAEAQTVVSEFGAGQFEINLHHMPDPLQAADQVIALRRAVRGTARAHGLDASFMAKPYGKTVGSGLHMHLSLWNDEGQNLFDSASETPNTVMGHAVSGMMRHMVDSQLVLAPHLNSYRRFVPDWIAPVEVLWALDHRGTAIRIPETQGKAARIEHRVAGADANPYLVSAAILAAALDGLDRSEDPPAPLTDELLPGSGPRLPDDWGVAERAFASSGFIADWMGVQFQHVFGSIKRQERRKMMARVSDVELEAYLRRA